MAGADVSSALAPASLMATSPPWLRLLARRQFEVNCLASVSIEVPALRPAFRAALAALDGDTPTTASESSSSDAPGVSCG